MSDAEAEKWKSLKYASWAVLASSLGALSAGIQLMEPSEKLSVKTDTNWFDGLNTAEDYLVLGIVLGLLGGLAGRIHYGVNNPDKTDYYPHF